MKHLTKTINDQIQESDEAQTVDEYINEADRMESLCILLRDLELDIDWDLGQGCEEVLNSIAIDFEDIKSRIRNLQILCQKQETRLIACMEELQDELDFEDKHGDYDQQVSDQYRREL